jgi:hypothetical protein
LHVALQWFLLLLLLLRGALQDTSQDLRACASTNTS